MEDEKSLIFKYRLMAIFASVLIPMVGFMLICKSMSITPFGDSTFLYEDMKQQYLDFYMYYKAVFKGNDGFLFSQNCGLGSKMPGIWAYYLSSPILVFFNIVPDNLMPQAITVFIMIKIVLISLTTCIFLLHRCRKEEKENRRNILGAVLFATAFSLSGWVVANLTNSMWLDAVIVMPIVFIFYEKMIEKEKRSVIFYALSVALMIICNYYISAMILLLMGAFSILLLVFGRIKGSSFGRFMYSSILGIALDLWFLVPVANSLLGSNKFKSAEAVDAFNKYLPTSEAIGKNISPLLVFSKLFSFSYDGIEIMEGLPNVYFGVLFLIPAILFFINRKIGKKDKYIFGSFIAAMLAMFCIAPFNTLMHGFTEAYGYLYRYSFMLSFVMIYIAYKEFINLDGTGILDIFAAVIICLALLTMAKVSGARFISLKVSLYNFAVIFAAGASCFMIIYGLSHTKRLFVTGLCLAACIGLFDLAANFVKVYSVFIPVLQSQSEYTMKDEAIKKALYNIGDPENYRIESMIKRSPNDSIHYSYKSVTTYSSILKVDDRILLYRMGYNDNGIYTEYDYGNTRTADALLGIKYIMVPENTEPFNNQTRLASDVIVNNTALDASAVNEKNVETINEYLRKNVADYASPFEVQTAIWNMITGENDNHFFDAAYSTTNQDDEWIFDITAAQDGDMFFYMNKDKETDRVLELEVNGEIIGNFGYASCKKVMPLGYHKEGEKVKLIIRCIDGINTLPSEPFIVTENIF